MKTNNLTSLSWKTHSKLCVILEFPNAGTRYARINRSFIAHSVLEELISFTNVKRGVISEMLRVQNLNRTQEI
ncbi:hypothetical protein ACS0TY_028069 [Phlomoides rotata]